MISPQPFADLNIQAYKTVQTNSKALCEIPESALLADVLRTLETQLQAKALVNSFRSGTFNPIWFLVETERNIFLWRNGYSLSRQCDFEFWVDLPALIAKRIRQIESGDPSNPFVNPYGDWNNSHADSLLSEALKEEKEYLKSFLRSLESIMIHAHALSQAGSLLAQEIEGREKPRILLPCNLKS